jgi:hypothetical protein
VAPTHSRRALVSVNYHYYQQLLSGDHLHHGLLAPITNSETLLNVEGSPATSLPNTS